MLAIHTNSGPFAKEWVRYCVEKRIPFKEVDCFAADIIEQVRGCQALFWHWEHHDNSAALFARQLIASVEKMGVSVFPDTATCWHYDDKVGQKYLLEATGAPLIPSHVFYEMDEALDWIEQAKLPLVWKLRGGAGSENVRLVETKNHARMIIRRSFRRGWAAPRWHAVNERLWQFRRDRTFRSFVGIGRGLVRTVVPHKKNRGRPVERGYVLFQDFVPENRFDIRVVVIGENAFGLKRMVRTGDFRASGSGAIIYDAASIPEACIRTAFDVTRALHSQSCAFDFVLSGDEWLIVEISYAISAEAYRGCPGVWDSQLRWHAVPVTPERFMIETLLDELRCRAAKGD